MSSSSKGWTRLVVPNVPSFVWRPARPATWASSEAVSFLNWKPSYFVSCAKATWFTSRFSPMPMASVAIRKSTSPFWYSSTCAFLVRGESDPVTTAAPPRSRLTSSAMAYTSSAEKATIALLVGIRVIFLEPAYSRTDILGRVVMLMRGSKSCRAAAMVSAPSNMVSCLPRRFRMRSVKKWPRSRSVASWTSSIATKSALVYSGMASTVQTWYLAPFGVMRSSPVTSDTFATPTLSQTLPYTSRASRRKGKPMSPLLCATMRSIAMWVLPVLVGPRTAVTP